MPNIIWREEPAQLGQVELMTVEEAAKRLSVSPSTVYRLIRAKDIEVKRIGRLVRIEPQALRDFIETR